jgi:hypothetical protein
MAGAAVYVAALAVPLDDAALMLALVAAARGASVLQKPPRFTGALD